MSQQTAGTAPAPRRHLHVLPGGQDVARAHEERLSCNDFLARAEAADPTNPAAAYLRNLALGASRESAYRKLKRFARLAGSTVRTLRWAELTFAEIERVLARLRDAQAAPATLNATLAHVRGVARQAFRHELMRAHDYHLILEIKRATGSRLPRGRALARAELAALFTACAATPCDVSGLRDAALIALLAGAGLRRAEAVGVGLQAYDPAARVLTVRGKGDKERRVPVADDGAHEALRAWLEVRGRRRGPLLAPVDRHGNLYAGDPVSAGAVYFALRRRAQEAGISPCSPHDLRHTYATTLLAGGTDATIVQALLGHARVETTLVYDHRGEEMKRQATRLAACPYTPRPKRKPRAARRRRLLRRVNTPFPPKARAAALSRARAREHEEDE